MGTSIIKIKLLFLCLLVLYSLPTFAVIIVSQPAGVIVEPPVSGMINFNLIGGDDADSVGGKIANIIKKLSMYVSIISVIAIIFGGIKYVTSFGEDEKAKKAKWIITYALIGTGFSVSAYSIVAIIAKISDHSF